MLKHEVICDAPDVSDVVDSSSSLSSLSWFSGICKKKKTSSFLMSFMIFCGNESVLVNIKKNSIKTERSLTLADLMLPSFDKLSIFVVFANCCFRQHLLLSHCLDPPLQIQGLEKRCRFKLHSTYQTSEPYRKSTGYNMNVQPTGWSEGRK